LLLFFYIPVNEDYQIIKTVRPILSDRCVSLCPSCAVLSVCNVRALWPNGWMDQGETWHVRRSSPDNIVLDGDPSPPKKAQPLPNFGPCLLWHGRPSQLLLSSCYNFLLCPHYEIGQAIIFLPCDFFSFFLFSSPNLSDRRLDVYHTSTHGVALVRI